MKIENNYKGGHFNLLEGSYGECYCLYCNE